MKLDQSKKNKYDKTQHNELCTHFQSKKEQNEIIKYFQALQKLVRP